jgi:uncharacterized protein YrzB (UPF0473 family)
MDKEKSTFTVLDDNGKEVVCDILFTFDSDETNKSYIVYTDNSKDENGTIQVFASIFNPNDPNTKLEEITTEKEWKVIESILSSLQEQIKEKNEQ